MGFTPSGGWGWPSAGDISDALEPLLRLFIHSRSRMEQTMAMLCLYESMTSSRPALDLGVLHVRDVVPEPLHQVLCCLHPVRADLVPVDAPCDQDPRPARLELQLPQEVPGLIDDVADVVLEALDRGPGEVCQGFPDVLARLDGGQVIDVGREVVDVPFGVPSGDRLAIPWPSS